jgi:hypothetical protein
MQTESQGNDKDTGSPLVEYADSGVKAPRICGWPINPEIVDPFVDSGKIITFTALVPLEKLVYEGIDGLNKYCMEAFESSTCTDISNTEFRVIDGQDENDDWDDRFQGDVALQVTCTLHGD